MMLLTFISCEKYESKEISKQGNTDNTSILKETQIINPYSVTNMSIAYANIKSSFPEDSLNIKPTHYYIKFMPIDDEQFSLLKIDSTLNIYDFPLDYVQIEGSGAYHDPAVPEGQPTYQYASVKVDYSFPNVPYQILENLYIPEEDQILYQSHENLIDSLVYESLRLTNNLGDEMRGDHWQPKGNIKLRDEDLDENESIPLEGVKVRARRLMTTYTGITNRDGHFECDGTFKYKANYSIKWERYDFEIRDSWLGTATYNGPYKKGDWNLDDTIGVQKFYGTIFKAAHHYYYKDIKGLRRPPQNTFWKTQLTIRAYNEANADNGQHCAPCRFLGLGSAIKIYNPQHPSSEIYGTVMHEIAHASHWNMDQHGYNYGCDINAESYARGVQWVLTNMVYDYNLFDKYSRYRYTGVAQDMIDGSKTTTSIYYYFSKDNEWVVLYRSYYDQVNGYTIRQIEDALIGQEGWPQWKNNIKYLYNNGTENNLDATFDYWILQ